MKMKIVFLIFIFIPLANGIASDLITDNKYSALRSQFLNFNEDLLFEIDIPNMSDAELQSFMAGTDGRGLRLDEYVDSGAIWNIFGAQHDCNNKFGEKALCWYATGGADFQNGRTTCGTQVNNDYFFAINNPANNCSVGGAGWPGVRLWLGISDNGYLLDAFGESPSRKASDHPINRICMEVSFPTTNVLEIGYNTNSRANDPDFAYVNQIVNPAVINPNYKYTHVEWGTYTATRTNANGTTADQEVGGIFAVNQSHFYHRPTNFNTPPVDKIFAIDEHTIVACMNNFPTGVRGAMRPPYIANPLYTLSGIDEANGFTDAANYLNYVTRFYFDIQPDNLNSAIYPFNITYNKIWAMYEDNEIFAADHLGGVLGVSMVKQGETAIYPFSLRNTAREARTYRIYMQMLENLTRISNNSNFELYHDVNKNNVLDAVDTLLPPNSLVTIPARESRSMFIVHRPDFTKTGRSAYGRTYLHGTVSLVEEGRLRSASYAIRTWELTDADSNLDQAAFIKNSKYPAEGNLWSIHDDKNMGLNVNSNPNLIRNSRDYINTFLGESPRAPEGLSIE